MVKAIGDGTGVFIVASTSGTASPAQWLVDWVRGGNEVDSGVTVTPKTSLSYAPVWYAVNRVAGHMAQMPLTLYRRVDERTVKRDPTHPAFRLTESRPNGMMTASVFKELLQYHALMWGNGRAGILRDRRGDPTDLIPLLPDRTRSFLLNGEKWHAVKLLANDEMSPDTWFSPAAADAQTVFLHDRDVLHVIGLGFDGIAGYPVWDLAKHSWGLGLAGERHQSGSYKNRAMPGLLLQAPPGVFRDDEDAKKFLNAFRSAHEGSENAGKAGLLREGITAQSISQSATDMQHLENRSFQRDEVSLWFLLETITGEKGQSYASIEEKNIAYLTNGLGRWLVKWTEQCKEKLLREREKQADSHLFRWNTGALLRANMKSTSDTLAGLVRGRIFTPNEAREKLDMNPLPGGDELQNPAIDTRAASGEDASDTSDRSDRSDRSDGSDRSDRKRLRAIVVGRLGELAGVEQRRLNEIRDKHGPESQEHIVSFYRGWKTTLAAAFETLGAEGVFAKTLADAWVWGSVSNNLGDPSWRDRFADRLLAGV